MWTLHSKLNKNLQTTAATLPRTLDPNQENFLKYIRGQTFPAQIFSERHATACVPLITWAPVWYAENRLTKSSFQKISPSHYLSFSSTEPWGLPSAPLPCAVQPSVTRQDSDTHDYTKPRWNEFTRSELRSQAFNFHATPVQ